MNDILDFYAEVDVEATKSGAYKAADPNAPIPNNSVLPVIIERASYTDDLDSATLNIMWRVTGGEHAHRVIFQKLMLTGTDRWNPEKSADKRRKGRTQLAVIIALTGAHKVEAVLRSGKLPMFILLALPVWFRCRQESKS